MDVYTYREILDRIDVAEEQLEAVLKQKQLIEDSLKSIKNELDYIRLNVEEFEDV